MKDSTPVSISRTDYRPPDWTIDETHLIFELQADNTTVTSTLHLRKLSEGPLRLDGVGLDLVSVSVNDVTLSSDEFEVSEEKLVITKLADDARLCIVTRINLPEDNLLS